MSSEFVDLGSILSSPTSTQPNRNRAIPVQAQVQAQAQAQVETQSTGNAKTYPNPKSQKNNKHSREAVIPSLYQICIQKIASKLERYPPEVFASLSETEWETIVKYRHRKSAPKTKTLSQANLGIDGAGRISPAISDKTMMEIEDVNPHLASSKVVDLLIWKDCVEYKFKRGGPARPKSLFYPYDHLVAQLNDSMKVLTGLIEVPPTLFSNKSLKSSETKSQSTDTKLESISVPAAHKAIYDSLKTLMEAPMSVDVLNDTKIGKSLAKFIKKLSKLSMNPEYDRSLQCKIWSREFYLEPDNAKRLKSSGDNDSPLAKSSEEHLQTILQGWKQAASTEGVKITSASTITSATQNTTDLQQFTQDMRVLKMCHSWRDLFEALTERQEHMLESHGAKMREKRQNMEKTKHSVKQVKLRANRFKSRAVMNILGNSSGIAISSSSAAGSSKVSSWKREQVLNKARQKGLKTAQLGGPKVSAFSLAVANATKKPTKRKGIDNKKKEMVLDGGRKRMRMPNRDRDNKFASNQLRSKLKRGFRR